MNKDEAEIKEFLQQQVEWCRKQDELLAEIEKKFYEMKRIAQYAVSHKLSKEEGDRLNEQLYHLKNEISLLERELQPIIH